MNTKSTTVPADDVEVPILAGNPAIELGKVFATLGALACLGKNGVDPLRLVLSHQRCQWGTLDQDDVAANIRAVKDGGRIFSSYVIDGDKVWVITEAVDDLGSRNSTTLLLPSEY